MACHYIKDFKLCECGEGWFVEPRGHIERCDTCDVFESDDEARHHVRACPECLKGAVRQMADFNGALCMDDPTDRETLAGAVAHMLADWREP